MARVRQRLATLVVAALALTMLVTVGAPRSLAATGDTDSALVLNGTSQYASVSDPGTSAFDLTTAVTLEAWVYATSACTNTGGQGIVTKDVSYMMYCVSGYWGYAFSGDGGAWTGQATNVPVEQNAWHHIAMSHSSTNNNLNFYFDGQAVETLTSYMPSTIGTNNNSFLIGSFSTGYYFNGKIDEVRVYSSVRTPTQIANDMNTWGPNDATQIAYYDFNDVSGSTVNNKISSPAANTNVTLSGSPTFSNVETSTVVNGDTVVTFPRSYLNANGGWKIPSHVSTLKSLVIAGGGGGGSRAGGGGGAGGYVYNSALSVTPNSYQSVVVGTGGIGQTGFPGRNGLNSSLGSLQNALGGGGGGHAGGTGNGQRAGRDGGSGGGASGDATTSGSSAAYGYSLQSSTYSYGAGFRGGSGYNGNGWPGGGGGGAGGVGANSAGGTGAGGNTGGKGGAGVSDPIGGTTTCYATGGGGGVLNGGTPSGTAGAGGDCGGTSNPNGNSGTAGSSSHGIAPARANTGSGGGGDGYNASGNDYEGGNGAAGVVVLRYPLIVNVSISYSGGSAAVYRIAGTITASSNLPGRATFYEKGKPIAGCKSVAMNGSNSATCTWKPSIHGLATLTATVVATNTYVPNGSSSMNLTVSKRTNNR